MPAVAASSDIHRVTWSYVVAILEELECGRAPMPTSRARQLASQLQGPADLLGMMDALLQLTVELWCEAHGDDISAARAHAQRIAIDMAGTPG